MEITEIGLLAIKSETTYGTDPTPDGTNVIPTIGDSITYTLSSTDESRKANDGTLDRIAGYNAMPYVTLKFSYELRTNGVADTGAAFPEIDPLMEACDLTGSRLAQSGGGHNGYSEYSTQATFGIGSSVTCYWWSGLKLHKLTGGKATFKLTYTAGKIPVMEFTVMGKYSAVSDAGLPSGVSFVAAKPPLFSGATVLLDGAFTPIVSAVTFELGNEIKPRKSAASADGIAGFVIVTRAAKLTLDPETEAVANYDFWGKYIGSTSVSLEVDCGTVTGQKTRVTYSNCEIKKTDFGDRDGIRIHQLELTPHENALGAGFFLRLRFF